MVISDTNKEFIDNLVSYYISEASSYKQIAEQYTPEIESIADAAFGIITGCVYASFLETCRNQQIQPELDDMTEFNNMIKARAAEIKKAIIDPASVGHATNTHSAESQGNSKKDAQKDIPADVQKDVQKDIPADVRMHFSHEDMKSTDNTDESQDVKIDPT